MTNNNPLLEWTERKATLHTSLVNTMATSASNYGFVGQLLTTDTVLYFVLTFCLFTAKSRYPVLNSAMPPNVFLMSTLCPPTVHLLSTYCPGTSLYATVQILDQFYIPGLP